MSRRPNACLAAGCAALLTACCCLLAVVLLGALEVSAATFEDGSGRVAWCLPWASCGME